MTLAQKFSSAMNGIDDEFIEEALTYERSKKRKPSCVLRIVLVAALISVLLFTSALAFSPSLRENTLNVLVEIFSDHATFRVEGDEPAGSYIAGKIDYSALEETYRLDPEGCYRVDFASGATFFGNNGEIISITVVAIRDGLLQEILQNEELSKSSYTKRGGLIMKKRIIQSLLAIACCVTVALSAIPTAEAAIRASVVTGTFTLPIVFILIGTTLLMNAV